MSNYHARDPGLQPERTALAWRRTMLTGICVALLCVRAATHSSSPFLIITVAMVLTAVCITALGLVLRRRRYCDDPQDPRIHAKSLLIAISVTVSVAGVSYLIALTSRRDRGYGHLGAIISRQWRKSQQLRCDSNRSSRLRPREHSTVYPKSACASSAAVSTDLPTPRAAAATLLRISLTARATSHDKTITLEDIRALPDAHCATGLTTRSSPSSCRRLHTDRVRPTTSARRTAPRLAPAARTRARDRHRRTRKSNRSIHRVQGTRRFVEFTATCVRTAYIGL
ncbi:DUF202 domain-containing protein [Rhodococcus opacus]|uniref:DUF202 domain-containing protein n=1 Tax=Rhodococcus opacus TaxID=37919 RepID=UPI0009B6F7CB